METSRILKVAVLPDGCLGVFPDSRKENYQFVYREAAGVYWDNDLECFKSTLPKDWGFPKWYQKIVSVVSSGLGLQLILCEKTIYEADHEGFAETIKKADEDFWR